MMRSKREWIDKINDLKYRLWVAPNKIASKIGMTLDHDGVVTELIPSGSLGIEQFVKEILEDIKQAADRRASNYSQTIGELDNLLREIEENRLSTNFPENQPTLNTSPNPGPSGRLPMTFQPRDSMILLENKEKVIGDIERLMEANIKFSFITIAEKQLNDKLKEEKICDNWRSYIGNSSDEEMINKRKNNVKVAIEKLRKNNNVVQQGDDSQSAKNPGTVSYKDDNQIGNIPIASPIINQTIDRDADQNQNNFMNEVTPSQPREKVDNSSTTKEGCCSLKIGKLGCGNVISFGCFSLEPNAEDIYLVCCPREKLKHSSEKISQQVQQQPYPPISMKKIK